MIDSGPIPAIHGVVRWRILDLWQWLWEEFPVSVSKQTLGRELRAMRHRKLSARPRHHAQASGAIDAFKKVSRRIGKHRAQAGRRCRRHKNLVCRSSHRPENNTTRGWATRGTRPSAPQDLRTASTYIFGAICPAEGKAVGLILPWCNTEAMNLKLAAISAEVTPGRHAALLLDQAGWHLTPQLVVPANISIVPLPAKCPELNPQENVWGVHAR